jgi:hypothetical protein
VGCTHFIFENGEGGFGLCVNWYRLYTNISGAEFQSVQCGPYVSSVQMDRSLETQSGVHNACCPAAGLQPHNTVLRNSVCKLMSNHD